MKKILFIWAVLSASLVCAEEIEQLEVSTTNSIINSPAEELYRKKDRADSESNTSKRVEDNRFLSHISVGLKASTMGGGLQVATPINNYFTLRAGFDYISIKPGSWDISLNDTPILEHAFGYIPEYKLKGEIQFINGNALVDFYPTKGIFHVTGGFFLGTNKLKARGLLVDQAGNPATLLPGVADWPWLDFDGNRLDITDANVNADLRLGGVIKPYFGFGLGRAVAKKRVSFKFELGMIYQGDYLLQQNGKKVTVIDDAAESFDDITTYKRWLKWWPMLSFQLSYRIF